MWGKIIDAKNQKQNETDDMKLKKLPKHAEQNYFYNFYFALIEKDEKNTENKEDKWHYWNHNKELFLEVINDSITGEVKQKKYFPPKGEAKDAFFDTTDFSWVNPIDELKKAYENYNSFSLSYTLSDWLHSYVQPLKWKNFEQEGIVQNSLYCYVNEENEKEDLLSREMGFICFDGEYSSSGISFYSSFTSSSVFKLNEFNEVSDKTKSYEYQERDIGTILTKPIRAFKKANLSPYPVEKIVETLTGQSIATLKNETALSFHSVKDKDMAIKIFPHYAFVFHFDWEYSPISLRFFKNDEQRNAWLKTQGTLLDKVSFEHTQKVGELITNNRFGNTHLNEKIELTQAINIKYFDSRDFYRTPLKIVEGNLTVEELDLYASSSILIRGNLNVKGTLYTKEFRTLYNSNCGLIVEGDLIADNFIAEPNSFRFIQVKGDVKITNVAFPYKKYKFLVTGKRSTKLLLHEAESTVEIKRSYDFTYQNQMNIHSNKISENTKRYVEKLKATFVSCELLAGALRDGKEIANIELPTPAKTVEENITAFLKEMKNTELDHCEIAGCELVEYKDSGDWIIDDLRGGTGTYRVAHDEWKIRHSRKKKGKKLIVPAITFLNRCGWLVDLFSHRYFDENPNIYNYWAEGETPQESWEKEKEHLHTDEHLALYWLLHFGFTLDDKYKTVKEIVLKNNLSNALPLIDGAIDFFDTTDAFYNIEVAKEGYTSGDIFLRRRANLIWLTYSYEYRGKENSFDKWWLSVTIYSQADENMIRRIRWLKNNLQKFNKWDELESQIKKSKNTNIVFLSYVLACNPNEKNKSSHADKFLHELNKHKGRFSSEANRSFAQIMLWDLKEHFTEKKLLKTIMDFYFRANFDSNEYKELHDAHWGFYESLDNINNAQKHLANIANTESEDDTENKAEKILTKSREFLKTLSNENIAQLVSAIKNPLSGYMLLEYIFTMQIKNKRKLLLELMENWGNDYNANRLFQKFLPTLIKDETDENINIILYLAKNTKGNWAESLGYAFIENLHQEKIFNKLLDFLKDIASEKTRHTKERFVSTVFVYLHETQNYPPKKLNQIQIEKLLDTCLDVIYDFVKTKQKIFFDPTKIIRHSSHSPLAEPWLKNKWNNFDEIENRIQIKEVTNELKQAIESALEELKES